jgi:hypothetical protein
MLYWPWRFLRSAYATAFSRLKMQPPLRYKVGFGLRSTQPTNQGILWVVNLPYPMIRQPVAQAAPLLLLPSFMSMDRHYRGAIDSLEQADQLISKATSTADIERGGEKVKEAKKQINLMLQQVI